MTGDRKQLILRILQEHRGPARAITAGQLAGMIFGDKGHDREVRALITELIVQDGYGEILASTGGEAHQGYAPGYFWAEDYHQVEAYYQVLVSRDEDLRHRMTAAWAARQRLARAPVGQEALL